MTTRTRAWSLRVDVCLWSGSNCTAPAPYRVEDDAIVLTQRFEGSHLVQVFKADEGGTRKNEFSLSPDGKTLFMKATLSSPKLSIPVVYTLTYRRVEATN